MIENVAKSWLIGCKALLLVLVTVAAHLLSEVAVTSWFTLVMLLWVSVNIGSSIGKWGYVQSLLNFVSFLLCIAATIWIHPFFALLMPISLFELGWNRFGRLWPTAGLLVIPVMLLPSELRLWYSASAALTLVMLSMNQLYARRLAGYVETIDALRTDRDGLARSLDRNQNFMRQSEYTFRLEERNRLSQQIHDQLGHGMTGALIQMEAAKRVMRTDLAQAEQLMNNAIGIAKGGIDRIRLTLRDEKPAMEQLGANRLRALLDEFAAKHDVRATFTSQGHLDVIEPIHWRVITENMLEALTNTLRYSQATAVSVEIKVLGTLIRAIVADNGKGAEKIVKGLGIVGMEERTATAGGTLVVDGSRGFSVTMLIPYQSTSATI